MLWSLIIFQFKKKLKSKNLLIFLCDSKLNNLNIFLETKLLDG